jgi:hypothetical protein
MLLTRFAPLLSLEVAHAWYRGPCADVGFLIPQDTARLLRGARLAGKLHAGALRVFFRTDAAGTPLASAAGQRLRVGLVALSPALANVTDGFEPAAGLLRYRNATAPDALDAPEQIPLAGQPFTHSLSRSARPVTASLEDAAGRTLAEQTVTRESGRDSVCFELGALEPGAFTLAEAYPDATTRSPCYVDPELARAGAFGVVEIEIDARFYASAVSLRAALAARSETLHYFVVARGYTPADVAQLRVQERSSAPGQPAELEFERVPAEQLSAGQRATAALLGDEGAQVVLFRSRSSVARRESGTRPLQLLRNGDALIERLPLPGRERGTAELVVLLSKTKP